MIDPKSIELGKELIALAEKYSEPRTIKIHPDHEVKPCEHEPQEWTAIFGSKVEFACNATIQDQAPRERVHRMKCKHCGAKIKAEKWVACD